MNVQSFLQRFERVVERHPDAVAILDRGHTAITYSELYAQASRLGQTLIERGAKAEKLIAIGLEKSPEYLVALLGVWFSGAAFVPLGPELPPKRLEFIVRDSRVQWVIISKKRQKFVEPLNLEKVHLEEGLKGQSSSHLPPVMVENQLAYVIYSSGSTGTPKGVLVTHRGIVNLLEAQILGFNMGPTSRMLFYLSTHFDASISDIGCTLLSGGTLCFESLATLASPSRLIEIIKKREITHLDIPPGLLRILDSSLMPNCLKTIIIGGESCPPEIARHWAKRFRVVNVYGPTEATVCTSMGVVDPKKWSRPILGKPLPNVCYHLLDSEQKPVSQGTPCELYIGGIGLARGYLNLPKLTASKFVERRGERLFRTGDRVIEYSDGQIEFLGRFDRQVKINGILIAPEEIEARLLQHPQIVQAVVVKKVRKTRNILQAYLVLKEGTKQNTSVSTREFERYLRRFLPRSMLPSRWEFLEKMPRTASGKVHFAELETRSANLISSLEVVPSTTLEKSLVEIWKKVLGLNSLQTTDDFFQLGGDSLGMIEMIAAAEAKGIKLSPNFVMAHPTIVDLVSQIQDDPLKIDVMSAKELRQDVAFDHKWRARLCKARTRPGEAPVSRQPQDIFLTGATGFLGSHLLGELLKQSDANVHCLVRATDISHGKSRIFAAMEKYHIQFLSKAKKRIIPVIGDLTKSRLGVSRQNWRMLCQKIDTIYHCGAEVNLLLSYSALCDTNVRATKEILHLMSEGRRKRLHYASTLSVFVATDHHRGLLEEKDDLKNTREIYGGYAQSKWAAEIFLRGSHGHAGPIAFYRLGLLTDNCKNGDYPNKDWLSLFIRGIASLGCLPVSIDPSLALDITPVDYAVAAMTHLSLYSVHPEGFSTFHIANSRAVTISELAETIRSVGIPLQEVSESLWQRRIAERIESASNQLEAAAFLALCRGFTEESSFIRFRSMDLFQATGVRFDTKNTEAGLAGSMISCPLPTIELLSNYVRSILNYQGAIQ